MLLVALAVHGQAGALQRLLGPAHVHEAARHAAPPWTASGLTDRSADHAADRSADEPATGRHPWLDLLPTWHEVLHGHGHAAQPPAPADRHALVERHHHDPADATVITQGGQASSGLDDAMAAASAGSVTALAALAGPLFVPQGDRRMSSPSPAPAPRWRNFDASLPDRPPRG
jgi:hypothetical protein